MPRVQHSFQVSCLVYGQQRHQQSIIVTQDIVNLSDAFGELMQTIWYVLCID